MPKDSSKNSLKVTILGCGASAGVPRPNLDWGRCDPNEPKNRRTRSSILIQHKEHNIVVDTGPDFRQQMINAKVTKLDAVIYTHLHADHTHGIDDLRSYVLKQNKLMPIYAHKDTLEHLKTTFSYCFHTPEGSNYPTILKAQEVQEEKDFYIADLAITPFLQPHGTIFSLGLRIKNIAYCTDISSITNEVFENLQNLDCLIIGALQYKPHMSHLNLTQALELIEKVKPAKAYLTHMHNELDYNELKASLPNDVEPAYDGCVIEL